MSSPVSPPLTVSTVDGATVGRPITTLKVSNGTLTVSGNTAIITTGGGGGSGTVTSVGLTETGTALTITGSPVTTSGTFNIAGAGTSSQVILGDLSLGTLTSGTVTGTGSANQVSYWTSSSVQAGSTGLTYDSTTGNLTVGGYVEVGTKITTPTGTDLTLDTVSGTDSGSIVISDGVDGQVSISANGAGAIKLGAASNPVTVSNVYTLPTAVTTDNGYVLTAQTDGSTAWAASSGGGAPTDAEYITLSTNGTLTNERVLTAGTGIGFVDGGAGSTLTIYNAGVTSLTAGTGISLNSSTGGVIITNTVAEGTITGSITDNQIAVGATTADELEGNAKFTYDQATQSLNIAAGTGTGTILSGSSDMVIRNSSGTAHSKITLGHDAANSDIKLDTDGTGLVEIHKEGTLAYSLPNVVTGANGYVLTAQTDGSTAWAASAGVVTFPLEGSNGSAAAPTYSFSSDTNTGMFRSAADTIGFTVGGNERMTIANNAIEGITFRVDGTDTAASPGFSFDPDNDTGMFSVSANTLSFSTGGSERLRIGSSGEILIAGTAAGTSGQVLTSGGSGAAVTWADAGGGNEFNAELVGVELDASGSGYDVFDILSAPPYGVARYTTGSVDTKQYFYPFIAPATGDLSEIIVNLTAAAGSATNLYYGFYRDNNGVPSTVLGYATVDGTLTGNISVTSFSSTIALTRGTQYWLSQNKSTTESITQRTIQNDYLPRIAPSSSFPSTTSGYYASLTSNSTVSAAPTDVTAEGLEGGVYFSGLGAKPHIGIKIL